MDNQWQNQFGGKGNHKRKDMEENKKVKDGVSEANDIMY